MPSDVPRTMRASVLLEPRRLELQERPVPAPRPGDVLVRVTAVGVCGSDVHWYREGRIGEASVTGPLVLGHEAGGVIVAVGDGVDRARIGHRVSIEPQRPNLCSPEVLAGHYNLDPDLEFYAVPGVDGAFQEYVTIPSHFAFDVPDAVSDDAAALIEPLSVAIASLEKARVGLGSRILVAGAGPIGILVAQAARAAGLAEIVVTDIDAGRRERALRFGATEALDPTDDIASLGVDAFVDATGVPAAIAQGIRAIKPAGRAVLVGLGPASVEMPLTVIQNRELVVTGVFRYTNTWPTAIGLASRGACDLDSIVTGHYPLAKVEAALNSTSAPGTLKSVVLPGE